MSSQVVAAPEPGTLDILMTGIISGVVGGSVACARAVKGLVDERVEAARREMEAERARIQEWQAVQAAQKEQMVSLQRMRQSFEDSERRLLAVQLTEGRADSIGEGPTGTDYRSRTRHHPKAHSIRAMLDELDQILQDLPAAFKEGQVSPYPRLVKHSGHLRQRLERHDRPRPEEIASFRETIRLSLRSYTESLDRAKNLHAILAQRVDSLINDVLLCMKLTSDPEPVAELVRVREQLLVLVQATTLKPTEVSKLENRVREIKEKVEFNVAGAAYRRCLSDSVTKHLADLGYESVESFVHGADDPTLSASLRVPGGEQVKITIQRNGQMSFQLCHESREGSGVLGDEGLAYFRQQEKRWCQDLQELIRRLARDGFVYNVGFERQIPDRSIPVVVVETADEIQTEEDEEEEERLQMLREKRKRLRVLREERKRQLP